MKVLFFLVLFVSFLGNAQELSKVRADFSLAANDKEIAAKLFEDLSETKRTGNKVLLVYKGAVMTILAKTKKKKKDKKAFFKEGVGLIEHAITTKPNNIEIRMVRLSIQEHAPKFLGYHKNKSEDKKFILDHYKTTTSKSLQAYVKSYVIRSKAFSDAEKEWL